MTDNCLDDFLCCTLLQVIDALDGRCGRTKIQKVAYFLYNGMYRAGCLPDAKLSFSFCHYGPRSGDVDTALDRLELHGYITAERAGLPHGYETVFVSTPWGKHSVVGTPQEVLEVLEFLEDMSARELELISTIHFVWIVHGYKGEDKCWKIVTELKPGARPIEICKHLACLVSKGYLQ